MLFRSDNAGLDSGDLVARLRKAIYDGLTTYGLDLMTPGGGIADMRELGVIESYKLKRAVVSSASEAAEVCPCSAYSLMACAVTNIYAAAAVACGRYNKGGSAEAGEALKGKRLMWRYVKMTVGLGLVEYIDGPNLLLKKQLMQVVLCPDVV